MLDLERRLAERARDKEPSAIRELLPYLKIDGMISLGGGYPNPDTFAFDRIEVHFKGGETAVLGDTDLTVASQYGPSDAHAGLRKELIAWHRSKDGIELDDSQIVVLNGSQEGLFIMAYLLINAEDREYGPEVVIPGHGPLCTTAELKRWVKYFNWLQDQVRQARSGGKTDAQIRKETAPPEDMKTWWRFLLWKHEDSLGKVLAAVQSGAL